MFLVLFVILLVGPVGKVAAFLTFLFPVTVLILVFDKFNFYI